MGDDVAFKFSDNTISSPCDGEITTIFPTGMLLELQEAMALKFWFI